MRRLSVPALLARVLSLSLTIASSAAAQPIALDAPNVVVISPQLVTSGQPSAATLAQLRSQGFEAVIYLAPPTVSDAVRDEPLIVAKQGLTFVNIPIAFDKPTTADVETFNSVLAALGARKVLVHCQINLRASSMVFLYRTLVLKEEPRVAHEAMAKVWSPTGPWRSLIEGELRRHRIAYELL